MYSRVNLEDVRATEVVRNLMDVSQGHLLDWYWAATTDHTNEAEVHGDLDRVTYLGHLGQVIRAVYIRRFGIDPETQRSN